MKTFRLCYIEGSNLAWFTSCEPFEEQWGDDWSDAPYQFNAESPYKWSEHKDTEPYELIPVYFWSSNYSTPAELGIDTSVQTINRSWYPWLMPSPNRSNIEVKTPIWAECTLDMFIRLIESTGGTIFLRKEDYDD